jgi:PAS domain-containing protein
MSKKERTTKKTTGASKEEFPSAQKPYKEELKDSEIRYEALLEHLPVGVYRTTPDG